MKKIKSLFLSLILVLALLVGVVACDNGGDGGKDTPDPVTYTLSFEMNGHGSQITEQVLEEDEITVQPENPTESGWEFEGWYTADGEEFDFDTLVTESVTLHAKWAKANYVSVDSDVDYKPYLYIGSGVLIFLILIIQML